MAQSTTLKYEMKMNAEDKLFKKADKLAVKIVSMVAEKVASKVDYNGELDAYDGIEAAREIRAMLIKAFG